MTTSPQQVNVWNQPHYQNGVNIDNGSLIVSGTATFNGGTHNYGGIDVHGTSSFGFGNKSSLFENNPTNEVGLEVKGSNTGQGPALVFTWDGKNSVYLWNKSTGWLSFETGTSDGGYPVNLNVQGQLTVGESISGTDLTISGGTFTTSASSFNWIAGNTTVASLDNSGNFNVNGQLTIANNSSIPSNRPTGGLTFVDNGLYFSNGTNWVATSHVESYSQELNGIAHFENSTYTTRGVSGTFSRTTSAYTSDGTLWGEGDPRFVDGHFGQAIFIEEGTTNLVYNSDFENNTSSVWSTKAAPSGSVAITSSEAFIGKNSYEIITVANGGWQGILQQVNNLTSGTTYTVSAYLNIPNNQEVHFGLENNFETIASGTGNWQRYSVTGQWSTTSDSNVVFYSEPTNTGFTFYVDSVQLEAKPYATSYMRNDSTISNIVRANESLTYPSSSLSTELGSISMWAKTEFDWYGQFHYDVVGILETDAGMSNQFDISLHDSSNSEISFRFAGAVIKQPYGVNYINNWHHYAVTWSGTTVNGYIDGQLVGTSTMTTTPIFNSQVYIGSANNNPANAYIDEVAFFSIALTPEQVYNIYTAPQPMLDLFATSNGSINGRVPSITPKPWDIVQYDGDGNIAANGLTLNNGFLITGDLTVNQTTWVTGNATVDKNLVVSGTTIFDEAVTFNGPMYVHSNYITQDPAWFNGGINVGGDFPTYLNSGIVVSGTSSLNTVVATGTITSNLAIDFSDNVFGNTNTNIQQVDGDIWITANAYYDGTNWQRYDTTKFALATQIQGHNNIPNESIPGISKWRAVPGSNPIGPFTAYGGWELVSTNTAYRDMIIGGSNFELDGDGLAPYGRVNQVEGSGTFLSRNAFYNGSAWQKDANDSPSTALEITNDGKIISLSSPSGTTQITWTQNNTLDDGNGNTYIKELLTANSITSDGVATIKGATTIGTSSATNNVLTIQGGITNKNQWGNVWIGTGQADFTWDGGSDGVYNFRNVSTANGAYTGFLGTSTANNVVNILKLWNTGTTEVMNTLQVDGTTTLKGSLTTAKNTLDDMNGNASFYSNVDVNGNIGINGYNSSGMLILGGAANNSSNDTAYIFRYNEGGSGNGNSLGAALSHNTFYTSVSGTYTWVNNDPWTNPSILLLQNGMLSFMSSSSDMSSGGSSNQAYSPETLFYIDRDGNTQTLNNTLDDGTGNVLISGEVNVVGELTLNSNVANNFNAINIYTASGSYSQLNFPSSSVSPDTTDIQWYRDNYAGKAFAVYDNKVGVDILSVYSSEGNKNSYGVFTYNNIMDDGKGNASIASNLKVDGQLIVYHGTAGTTSQTGSIQLGDGTISKTLGSPFQVNSGATFTSSVTTQGALYSKYNTLDDGSGNIMASGTIAKVANISTTGNFGVSTNLDNADDVLVTSTNPQTILTYTPPTNGNYVVYGYFRVVASTTNVTFQVKYTDGSGAQVHNIINNVAEGIESYSISPYYFNAKTSTPIEVVVTTSIANQVYVSASIVGI